MVVHSSFVMVFIGRYILQGDNPKKPGTPNSVRLYSIASTRYGDEFNGNTASLCVRRAVYWDPETGKEDPAKKGLCSNFLCDAKPGDKVQITGKVHPFLRSSSRKSWTPYVRRQVVTYDIGGDEVTSIYSSVFSDCVARLLAHVRPLIREWLLKCSSSTLPQFGSP